MLPGALLVNLIHYLRVDLRFSHMPHLLCSLLHPSLVLTHFRCICQSQMDVMQEQMQAKMQQMDSAAPRAKVRPWRAAARWAPASLS